MVSIQAESRRLLTSPSSFLNPLFLSRKKIVSCVIIFIGLQMLNAKALLALTFRHFTRESLHARC